MNSLIENAQRPKRLGPLTIYKKFGNLESLSSLGDDVKGAIERGLADPKFGLELDHGRAILRVELEVVVNPVVALAIKDNYEFKAEQPGGECQSVPE